MIEYQIYKYFIFIESIIEISNLILKNKIIDYVYNFIFLKKHMNKTLLGSLFIWIFFIVWVFADKSENVKISQQILSSHEMLSQSVTWQKYISQIDLIYQQVSTQQAQKLWNKLQKIPLNIREWKKYGNILDYLEAKIFIKIANSQDISHQLLSNSITSDIEKIEEESFSDQQMLSSLEELKDKTSSQTDIFVLDYHIFATQLWILLNHQRFSDSQLLQKQYFHEALLSDQERMDFLVEYSTYRWFSILRQFIEYQKEIEINNIWEKRYLYHPDEQFTAYNQVRISGYYWLDCNTLTIKDKWIDSIDKSFCELLNNTEFDKNSLDEIAELNSNLQNLSDTMNYYGAVLRRYPELTDELKGKQKQLWEQIIATDKHFVNGYLWIISYFNYKKDCDNFKKYFSLLDENFIWDDDIKQALLSRTYVNCSLE